MTPLQQTEPRVRTTLHPLAVVGLIGAGLMLVLLVVGIGMLIVILKDSRDHIRAQDAKTAVLLAKLEAATPTARQVSPLIADARPVLRTLGREIGPLGEAVAATATATERLPALVRVTETFARVAFPVLGELGRLDLTRALDSTNRLIAEVEAQNLVPASARAARETPLLIRRLLRVQLATLRSQRASLQTQLATLEIQRQALASIKSIDRKTGGTVPPQGAPVPQP
jgi:hypothetical protein